MESMSKVSKAKQIFRDGRACSQAVLEVYGTALGLTRKQAIQIAAGFAGGMRQAETCGAVTGAFMVLGLRHCVKDCATSVGRAEVYTHIADFTAKFKKRNGSLTCRDLLGCDISTAEGLEQAKKQNLFKTTCVKMVEDAAEILEAMETESRQTPAGDDRRAAPGA
jgi:C_GCAxxG_C_C family probable redox protein